MRHCPVVGVRLAAPSSFYILKRGIRSPAIALQPYLLSFHQHSRFVSVSGVIFHTHSRLFPESFFKSFVFINIPGYTFIFAIIFLLYDSLQSKLITDLISNTWFLGKSRPISAIPSSCFVFMNIPGSIEIFLGLLPIVAGAPPHKPTLQG